MSIILLAIESSCDDTSAAVIKDGNILSNCVANQEVHKLYGGVVPEAASRAHQVNIVPVVDAAIKKAGIEKSELSAIAFTRGPGLVGSLHVGVAFAKALALSLDIPMIEVNHMQAHVLAHFAEDPKPQLPFLCLTVSGGHTQIVLVRDQPVFEFTEPKVGELDFSFSGLKTSILYFLKKELKSNPDFIKENMNDICASVQNRIVSILLNKLKIAAKKTGIKEVAIAGGVSANSELRHTLTQIGEELGWTTYIPRFEYCTDNAAMIAVTAHFKFLKKEFVGQDITPDARLKI